MLNVVILAAGKGTRMRSDLPKVLHPLAGKPMLAHVLATARRLGAAKVCVVYGHGGELVPQKLAAPDIAWALQEPQLGTGHAVQVCLPQLGKHPGRVVVLAIAFAASVSFDRLPPALGVPLVFLLLNYLADVIGSLWPVADEAARLTMARFYERLVTGGLGKTAALRIAQLELLRDKRMAHPFFWAPFILIGNWL